ncbi:hypothetical protein OGAPHI_003592 [Ogataea philodendri]|uniref:mannose-1-phosphate guanylyltransferase n=1 Tax=Ogataea philodendri TaxID=1378263 RepID=A0A9P8P403_9ASCO|nr:uncharacterized protein OGAPHI_003592 [Ogataea philodendri]KAH3665408.1 hypothetical protein OGAPHI_003592 [Ogataea philodendri]
MISKAVVMVGGGSRGTRFRPLALDQAKIMFPIAGKPLLAHTIDAILTVPTIKEILLIGFYDASVISDLILDFNTQLKFSGRDCTLKYLKEFKALGTAGGLYHFREEILRGNPDGFLVIHGDIVCSFPLQDMIRVYETKVREAEKIDALLFGVKLSNYDLFVALNGSEQSSFGTIASQDDGKVVHYVEKPESKISDVINGGIYIFNESLFRRLSHAKISKITIANDNTNFEFVDEDVISMEKDILHNIPDFGKTYVYQYKGFWKAIKTPSDALWANELYLERIAQDKSVVANKMLQKPSINIKPPVLIHPSATVNYENGTKIGPYVSIGRNCVVGAGTRISNSIILDGCEVGENSIILNSIISLNCKIGNWSRIEGTGINLISINDIVKRNGPTKIKKVLNADNSRVIGIKDSGNICILGSGTHINDDLYVLNSFILPNKSIKDDVRYEIVM